MYHYRKKHKKYKSYPKPETCDFCDVNGHHGKIVEETEHCYIVPNRTFYDLWDHHDVHDHLLLIPKYHTDTLNELEEHVRLELMNTIAKYEAQNYNVYARAPGNKKKSVHHQHTHLIKIDTKPGKFVLYSKKPYFLFKF